MRRGGGVGWGEGAASGWRSGAIGTGGGRARAEHAGGMEFASLEPGANGE